MQKIVVDFPRTRIMAVAAVMVCIAVGGVVSVVVGGSTLVGWLAIIFPGAAAGFLAHQLRDKTPRLVIVDRGVFDRALRMGVIEWDDIEDAWSEGARAHPILWLEVRDPAKYLERVPPMWRRPTAPNARNGHPPLWLNL
ncbi:MAG TPA: STM3941 family protein, partial [Longimicrobium sp.]